MRTWDVADPCAISPTTGIMEAIKALMILELRPVVLTEEGILNTCLIRRLLRRQRTRRVELVYVVLDHALRAERRRDGAYRLLHDGHPAGRHVALAAVVVERDEGVFEGGVEAFGVGEVLLLLGGVLLFLSDGPAVVAVVRLGPPAVEDAEVGGAVEGSLLAGGAAGFE